MSSHGLGDCWIARDVEVIVSIIVIGIDSTNWAYEYLVLKSYADGRKSRVTSYSEQNLRYLDEVCEKVT